MQSWFKPVVLAIGLAFGASAPVWAADPIEEIFAQVSKGQFRQALTNIDRVLEKNPKDLNARFLRGVVLSETNRPDEAIDAFKSLIAEQPDLPEPYNNLAALYAQQRRYLDARESLERAIRINPAYTTALENLGDLYLRLAADIYAKARNLEDASPETAQKLSAVKNLIGGNRDTQLAAPESKKSIAAVAPAPAPAPVAAAPVPAPTPAPAVIVAAAPVAAPKENAAANQRVLVEKAVAELEAKAAAKSRANSAPSRVGKADKPAARALPPEPAPEREAPAVASASAPEMAVAPSPEPQHEAATAGQGVDSDAVEQALQNWAQAWANKDLDAYFASYAADFRPGKGGRAKWENERRSRISKPSTITIDIDNLQIKPQKDRAVVTFLQRYRSPIHRSDELKTMVFAMRDGEWRILEEHAGK